MLPSFFGPRSSGLAEVDIFCTENGRIAPRHTDEAWLCDRRDLEFIQCKQRCYSKRRDRCDAYAIRGRVLHDAHLWASFRIEMIEPQLDGVIELWRERQAGVLAE